jgi:zinc protease
MKTTFKLITLFAVAFISVTVCSAEFTLPKYQKVILKNGLSIYLMEQHEVPLIDVYMVVKAGASIDKIPGLAKITADNLLLGTDKLTRTAFEQNLEFVGTKVDANTDIEYSYLSASMANQDVNFVLPILGDALMNPAFDDSEFKAQKERLLADLARKKESPRAKIGHYFNALLYKDHPYSNDIDGNPRSIIDIKLMDVKTFHQHEYTPDNSAIIVAGDFESTNMLQLLDGIFSAWQGKHAKSKPIKDITTPSHSNVLLVNKADATESTFMIGGLGIARGNKDYVAISVINTVLGGRFTSWLNDELRVNSGLTYGARSRFDTQTEGGSFAISTFTKTSTTKEAIDLALKTYAKLWEQGIDEQTLASAKSYVKGQFPPRYETSGDLANLLAEMFVYGFDEQYINTFTEQVNQLNPKLSKELITKYFPKNNLQFVIVGQSALIKEQLQSFGQIIETDITSDTLSLP